MYRVVLGEGKRMFDSGTVPASPRLVDSGVFPNGMLKLDFATAGEPKFGNVGDPRGSAQVPDLTTDGTDSNWIRSG